MPVQSGVPHRNIYHLPNVKLYSPTTPQLHFKFTKIMPRPVNISGNHQE